MRRLSDRYLAATSAIDSANQADPQLIEVRGDRRPLALAHGQLATEWVEHLSPDADETVLLAARAHHLRRWEVPRVSYPEGRGGYLRWRKYQKARHALDVEQILLDVGYGADQIARVQALIRRDHLATDADAQTVEDAACLVFIETQLTSLESRLDHDRMVEVIRKTAGKMSPAGLDAVAQIDLDPTEQALLAEALST